MKGQNNFETEYIFYYRFLLPHKLEQLKCYGETCRNKLEKTNFPSHATTTLNCYFRFKKNLHHKLVEGNMYKIHMLNSCLESKILIRKNTLSLNSVLIYSYVSMKKENCLKGAFTNYVYKTR